MEELKKFLSGTEVSELEMFIERPIMVEAVKKVIMKNVMYDGVLQRDKPVEPNKNYLLELVGGPTNSQGMINNEALGQNLRAKWEAVRLVVNGFVDLEKFKKVAETVKIKENKAR